MKKVNSVTPGCFVFMLDQSGSMEEPFGGDGTDSVTKMKGATDAVNKCLRTILRHCIDGQRLKDRVYLGLWGYGHECGPLHVSPTTGQPILAASEFYPLAEHEIFKKKVSDGAGGVVAEDYRLETWCRPTANGSTPMRASFEQVGRAVAEWMGQHPTAHPATVINITDGDSKDGDPSDLAHDIMKLRAADNRPASVYNVHISSTSAPSVTLPSSAEALPDEFARLLFGMSSVIPDELIAAARMKGTNVAQGARGFSFNANLVDLIEFLEWGTVLEFPDV